MWRTRLISEAVEDDDVVAEEYSDNVTEVNKNNIDILVHDSVHQENKDVTALDIYQNNGINRDCQLHTLDITGCCNLSVDGVVEFLLLYPSLKLLKYDKLSQIFQHQRIQQAEKIFNLTNFEYSLLGDEEEERLLKNIVIQFPYLSTLMINILKESDVNMRQLVTIQNISE